MTSSAPTVDDLLKQGIAAVRAGRKDEARQKLTLLVEVDEKNEQAWLWLSGVVESNADRRVCLENVLTINPNNAAAQRGLRLLDGQTTRQRRERCPHCQAELPPTATICRSCQQPVLIACPQCQGYVEIVTRKCPHCGCVLGDYHDRDTYYLGLAESYLKHDNYQNALWAAERITVDPANSTALTRLAELYLRLDKTSRALEIYRQAIERDPRNVTSYLKLGQLYRQQDLRAEMQALYEEALRHLPGEPSISIAWARAILDIRGANDQAIELLRQVVKQQPDNAEAQALLGRAYLRADHPTVALTHYRRVAELAPAGSPEADEAERELRLLKQVEPDGWGEFSRHMLGFMLCPIFAALSAASLSPLKIGFIPWVALLVSVIASWIWVSSADMPRNPITLKVFGANNARRLHSPMWNAFGKFLWAFSFVILVVWG